MYKLDVTLLVHSWPRVQLIVNSPEGVVEKTVYFDRAMEELPGVVKEATGRTIDNILASYDPKHIRRAQ